MLPERFLLGRPVRSLQTMLRAISLSYPFLPRLVPDGIFEERTELAVVLFQQNFGLPPTGTVDNATWDAIASVYRGVVARTRLPRGADVYPSPSFRVEPGGETLHLLVVQSMFKSLSHVLDEVQDAEVDGRHADGTAANTLWLQGRGNLEESGVFDNLSWDLLTRLYAIFITRNLSVE